jgi:glyoxylase-like metal-dependent hydrolase (beta-lactamase superfamily II)
VNAYRIEGDRPVLVDAGPRTREAEEALRHHLSKEPVEILIVTHEHVDHAGLSRRLQEEGVEVWLHKVAAEPLERWNEDAALREADYEAGLVAAAVPGHLVERMRYGGRKYDHWSEPVVADRTFSGGDRMELGGRTWTVTDAPGHTQGSFLLSDGEFTFSGDTLLERITPNAVSVRDSERRGLVSYLATLGGLLRSDWGLVLPGHGAPFRDAGTVIAKALRHAELRQARVLRELGPSGSTAWEAVERLFPNLPENQTFLAVSEILGHLEVLRTTGRVDIRRRDGTDHYRSLEQAKD